MKFRDSTKDAGLQYIQEQIYKYEMIISRPHQAGTQKPLCAAGFTGGV